MITQKQEYKSLATVLKGNLFKEKKIFFKKKMFGPVQWHSKLRYCLHPAHVVAGSSIRGSTFSPAPKSWYGESNKYDPSSWAPEPMWGN